MRKLLTFTLNTPPLLNRPNASLQYSNLTQRRRPPFRLQPRASQQPTPQPSPPPTPAPAKPGLLRRLHLTPLDSPALFRGPEAVAAVIAVGMVMAVAFLANASRRIASDIAERARNVANIRNLQQRNLKKIQQQQYLESAVEATRATLLNTESFLAAQVKRAEVAELRLSELNCTRQDVEAAMEKTRQKRAALVDVERALHIERSKVDMNEGLVASLEDNIALRKESLQVCETDAELARTALKEAEESANVSLEMALQDKKDLERALEQRKAQLQLELEEQNAFMKTYAVAERELESASGTFEKTISDLESRRQHIDRVSAEADAIKDVLVQKEANLQAIAKGEVDASEMHNSLQRIQGEQQNIRNSLQEMNTLAEAKTEQRKNLLERVAAREKEIAELRERLEVMQKSNNGKESKLENLSDTPTLSTGEVKTKSNFEISELELRPEHALEQEQVENGAKNSRAHSHEVTDEVTQLTEGNLQTSNEAIGKDSMELSSSMPKEEEQSTPKRRVGRPRKATTSTSSTSSDAPKRGRGRPRKTVAVGEAVSEVAPKRKRGRPRKNPLPQVE